MRLAVAIPALLGIGMALMSCTVPAAPTASLSSIGSTLASGSLTPQATASPTITRVAISPGSLILNTPYDPAAGSLANANFPYKAQLVGTVYLSDGDFEALTANDSLIPDILWTSSNPDLVSVDPAGNVAAVSPGVTGTAVITAAARGNPAIAATASIAVVNNGKVQLDVQ
ncbi:MAG: hypothetical protein KGR26_00735 [Cyanobacteria bacterium REEB65]|nr:hypothetical protein [Cyanobacteria bacterium REEB65]